MQHYESCTVVWLGKNPPLVMGMRKGVCNILSHTLKFGWVRLSPSKWEREKTFTKSKDMFLSLLKKVSSPVYGNEKRPLNIWSYALEFVWVRLPMAIGHEKSRLQHLDS